MTQAVPDRKEGTLSWFLSPQENKYMDSFLLFFKIINPFLFLNSFSAFFLLFSAFFDSRQDVDSFRFPVPIPVEVRPDVCQRLNCFPPRMKAMFAELKHHFSPSPSLLNLKWKSLEWWSSRNRMYCPPFLLSATWNNVCLLCEWLREAVANLYLADRRRYVEITCRFSAVCEYKMSSGRNKTHTFPLQSLIWCNADDISAARMLNTVIVTWVIANFSWLQFLLWCSPEPRSSCFE